MCVNDTAIYEIKVEDAHYSRWSEWSDEVILSSGTNGETTLSRPVTDHAALDGLLNKVRDLGLPLLSVCRRDPELTLSDSA